METQEYYEDLPSITLVYEGQEYSLFAPREEAVCIFGFDYKPETIDIPLEEGDQYNAILFDSPLYYTVLELKHHLGIEQVDISLEFPSLEISLHQDLPYVKKLTMYNLYSMHTQLLLSKDMEESPLQIVLQKVCYFDVAFKLSQRSLALPIELSNGRRLAIKSDYIGR
jgi:hypothetical protein